MDPTPILRRQGARRGLAWLLAALLLCGTAFAQDRDAESRGLRSFAAGVGKFLYFLAWPTATYDDVRFDGFRRQPGGVDLQLTLSGSSAFDDSLLWTQLVLEIRDGQVSDIRWGRNNALLVPPGATMKNMLQALAALSREYARANPSPAAAAAPTPAPMLAVCVSNPLPRPVSFHISWAGREEDRTLPSGRASLYWATGSGADFVVSFDDSRFSLAGVQRNGVPVACDDAEIYNFQASGPTLGLQPARWMAGFPHPFEPHVVAGTIEGKWVCAAGYKWYDPDDNRSLDCVSAQVGYVGLRLQPVAGAAYPFIQGVRSNGPAALAGIGEGTWLMSVDGVSMQNRSVDEAAAALRGLPGVRVTLGVAQSGATERLFNVTRE